VGGAAAGAAASLASHRPCGSTLVERGQRDQQFRLAGDQRQLPAASTSSRSRPEAVTRAGCPKAVAHKILRRLGVCVPLRCACNSAFGIGWRHRMTARLQGAFLAICAITAVTATPVSAARRITLNDTGMVQCLDHHNDWSSECQKSGQDAAEGRDVDYSAPEDGFAGFSFRKICRSGEFAGEGNCPVDPVLGTSPNDWGCVYDNVTKVAWETKTDDAALHDGHRGFTNRGRRFHDDPTDVAWLLEQTNAEGLCGAKNWRLPDELELQSIVAYGMAAPGMSGPLVDHTFFPNSVARESWTRSRDVADSKRAWYVQFGLGRVGVLQRFDTGTARLVYIPSNSSDSVSAMRQTIAKERFIPSSDGSEITDILTGLVWRRCAEGMGWNNATQACEGSAKEFTWEDALDHIRANRQGGWRIPNVKELFSIVDHNLQRPAIDPIAFPNTPLRTFLTSTPMLLADDIDVHLVAFTSGTVYQQEYRSDTWLLRTVRRGRE
jgi:hypothetical protein